MRVFVTGASGFIGSAAVKELLSGGHSVLGMARSDEKAAVVAALGAEVHRGDLADPESFAAGARACDGVAHLAFNHDWVNSTREQAADQDKVVVEAMLAELEGSGKPFVLTSGTALMDSGGRSGSETDVVPNPTGRALVESIVVAAAARGVRSSVVRLSPTVHGAGEHGFVPMLIDLARKKGLSAYIGDGENRWPAVHRFDAARLYRLALEKAEAGTRWHAAAEEGIPMRVIASAIGEGLGVPVRSLTPEEAAAHFEWFKIFVGIDNPTSSALTRQVLGWEPKEMGLLQDMKESGYF